MSAMTIGRIALFGINYWPEQTGIAPYTTGLAEYLVQRGWQVTVCAGMPHYPQWHVADDYAGRLRRSEMINGVDILRFRHHVPEQPSAAGRALYEATFLAHALSARRLPRPDVVLGVVPSLSGGALAALAAKRYHVPFGVVFQDLMGQAAVQSGISGGARVARATRALESSVARRAAIVGVIAEGFRSYLEDLGVEPGRIQRVRNWTHIGRSSRPRAEVRARLGLPLDAWVCLHAGNMGLKQGLENVIDSARLALSSAPEMLFVLMGDGNQRAHLQRLAGDLPNVRFLPPQTEETFPDALAAADLLLVNQRPTVKDMSLPGKLTSYFAAGRPVVAAVAELSETATELRAAKAGIVVPAGAPEKLLAAVRDLAGQPARAAQLGRQGQAYADEHLTAGAILAQLEHFVLEIADPRFARHPLAWPVAPQAAQAEQVDGAELARRVG